MKIHWKSEGRDEIKLSIQLSQRQPQGPSEGKPHGLPHCSGAELSSGEPEQTPKGPSGAEAQNAGSKTTTPVDPRTAVVESVSYHASGSLSFLRYCQAQAQRLKGPVCNIEIPSGNSPWEIIWREILLKIKNQWVEVIEHEELCHCRRVASSKVDLAIVYGAHSAADIRKRTSANTGCGTCLPVIEDLLKQRLEANTEDRKFQN